MAKKTSKKLTKKQHNQAAVKALVTAAKQIETQGVEPLEPGSYPFAIDVSIIGELLVKNGSAGGVESTKIDFSINDVLRSLAATMPEFETAVSDALAWHKKATKETKKKQDAITAATLLKLGKRRKMTSTVVSIASNGVVSAKPAVNIRGSVGSRQIDMGVTANG